MTTIICLVIVFTMLAFRVPVSYGACRRAHAGDDNGRGGTQTRVTGVKGHQPTYRDISSRTSPSNT